MSRSEKDRLPPPKAGQPISARYLRQEHRRARRNAIVGSGGIATLTGEGGTAIMLKLPRMVVARTTSTITAATYSGGDITAFGTGTANGYVAKVDSAEVDAGLSRTIYQIGTSTIASGTTVLLYPLFGESLGLFVLGKVC